MRKAQATLFIILGIILVAVVILLYTLFPKLLPEQQPLTLQEKAQEFEERIQDCLEQEAKVTLKGIGVQAGQIYLRNYLTTSYGDIGYAYNDKKILPSIREIESEISEQLETIIPICTYIDVEPLTKTEEPLKVETEIEESSIGFTLSYPVTLEKDSTLSEINENFYYTIPVRLGLIHSAVEQIIINEKDLGGDYIDLTLLRNLDFKISVHLLDETNSVYIIEDEKFMIDENPYIFAFANKFSTGGTE